MINFEDENRHQFEVDFRHKQAWAAYHKFRHCLINPQISLKLRLKLFDAIISPTVLFGIGAKLPSTTLRNTKISPIHVHTRISHELSER